MPSMTQLYLLQIAGFALAQTGVTILGDMLFVPVTTKKCVIGVGCILLATAIFYSTAPR